MPDCNCSAANDRQRIIDNASWLAGRDVRLITLSGLISGEPGTLYPQICALVIPADVNPHALGREFSKEVLFSANYTDTRRDPSQRTGMKEQDMVDEAVKLLRRDIERVVGRVIQCDQHGIFYIEKPNLRRDWSNIQRNIFQAGPYPARVPRENTKISQPPIFVDYTKEELTKALQKTQPTSQVPLNDLSDSDSGIFERASYAASQALRDDLRAVAYEVGEEERQRTAELERRKSRESSRSRIKPKRAIEPTPIDPTKRRKARKL
ncbi:uncharacterized protein LAJ45_08473 [Morchella importuna]|uniref:Uncharacterized protein n=1 Tax=Morchella conica CCBAS932 TaxID=1392247 RepID=A0A3N4K9P2_9PEZI|nr:uncharacterized protein LAJ45_08473 [Morchella importuna]KAH8147645.1 hypothetical protein LAJ45_08473 [Morchella importuna]RPB07244.1 hypothetical protein P167DRAFT_599021 [Morchella conica CCBAS932]